MFRSTSAQFRTTSFLATLLLVASRAPGQVASSEDKKLTAVRAHSLTEELFTAGRFDECVDHVQQELKQLAGKVVGGNRIQQQALYALGSAAAFKSGNVGLALELSRSISRSQNIFERALEAEMPRAAKDVTPILREAIRLADSFDAIVSEAQAGRWQIVLNGLGALLSSAPAFHEARVLRGMAEIRLGMHEAAYVDLTAVIESGTTAFDAYILRDPLHQKLTPTGSNRTRNGVDVDIGLGLLHNLLTGTMSQSECDRLARLLKFESDFRTRNQILSLTSESAAKPPNGVRFIEAFAKVPLPLGEMIGQGAVGYLFWGAIRNQWGGGYKLSNEEMQQLGEILGKWAPLLAAGDISQNVGLVPSIVGIVIDQQSAELKPKALREQFFGIVRKGWPLLPNSKRVSALCDSVSAVCFALKKGDGADITVLEELLAASNLDGADLQKRLEDPIPDGLHNFDPTLKSEVLANSLAIGKSLGDLFAITISSDELSASDRLKILNLIEHLVETKIQNPRAVDGTEAKKFLAAVSDYCVKLDTPTAMLARLALDVTNSATPVARHEWSVQFGGGALDEVSQVAGLKVRRAPVNQIDLPNQVNCIDRVLYLIRQKAWDNGATQEQQAAWLVKAYAIAAELQIGSRNFRDALINAKLALDGSAERKVSNSFLDVDYREMLLDAGLVTQAAGLGLVEAKSSYCEAHLALAGNNPKRTVELLVDSVGVGKTHPRDVVLFSRAVLELGEQGVQYLPRASALLTNMLSQPYSFSANLGKLSVAQCRDLVLVLSDGLFDEVKEREVLLKLKAEVEHRLGHVDQVARLAEEISNLEHELEIGRRIFERRADVKKRDPTPEPPPTDLLPPVKFQFPPFKPAVGVSLADNVRAGIFPEVIVKTDTPTSSVTAAESLASSQYHFVTGQMEPAYLAAMAAVESAVFSDPGFEQRMQARYCASLTLDQGALARSYGVGGNPNAIKETNPRRETLVSALLLLGATAAKSHRDDESLDAFCRFVELRPPEGSATKIPVGSDFPALCDCSAYVSAAQNYLTGLQQFYARNFSSASFMFEKASETFPRAANLLAILEYSKVVADREFFTDREAALKKLDKLKVSSFHDFESARLFILNAQLRSEFGASDSDILNDTLVVLAKMQPGSDPSKADLDPSRTAIFLSALSVVEAKVFDAVLVAVYSKVWANGPFSRPFGIFFPRPAEQEAYAGIHWADYSLPELWMAAAAKSGGPRAYDCLAGCLIREVKVAWPLNRADSRDLRFRLASGESVNLVNRAGIILRMLDPVAFAHGLASLSDAELAALNNPTKSYASEALHRKAEQPYLFSLSVPADLRLTIESNVEAQRQPPLDFVGELIRLGGLVPDLASKLAPLFEPPNQELRGNLPNFMAFQKLLQGPVPTFDAIRIAFGDGRMNAEPAALINVPWMIPNLAVVKQLIEKHWQRLWAGNINIPAPTWYLAEFPQYIEFLNRQNQDRIANGFPPVSVVREMPGVDREWLEELLVGPVLKHATLDSKDLAQAEKGKLFELLKSKKIADVVLAGEGSWAERCQKLEQVVTQAVGELGLSPGPGYLSREINAEFSAIALWLYLIHSTVDKIPDLPKNRGFAEMKLHLEKLTEGGIVKAIPHVAANYSNAKLNCLPSNLPANAVLQFEVIARSMYDSWGYVEHVRVKNLLGGPNSDFEVVWRGTLPFQFSLIARAHPKLLGIYPGSIASFEIAAQLHRNFALDTPSLVLLNSKVSIPLLLSSFDAVVPVSDIALRDYLLRNTFIRQIASFRRNNALGLDSSIDTKVKIEAWVQHEVTRLVVSKLENRGQKLSKTSNFQERFPSFIAGSKSMLVKTACEANLVLARERVDYAKSLYTKAAGSLAIDSQGVLGVFAAQDGPQLAAEKLFEDRDGIAIRWQGDILRVGGKQRSGDAKVTTTTYLPVSNEPNSPLGTTYPPADFFEVRRAAQERLDSLAEAAADDVLERALRGECVDLGFVSELLDSAAVKDISKSLFNSLRY